MRIAIAVVLATATGFIAMVLGICAVFFYWDQAWPECAAYAAVAAVGAHRSIKMVGTAIREYRGTT